MAVVNSKVCKNHTEKHYLVGDKLFVHQINQDYQGDNIRSFVYEINTRTIIADHNCQEHYGPYHDSNYLYYGEDLFLIDICHSFVLKALDEDDSITLNLIFDNIEIINSKKGKFALIGFGEIQLSSQEILTYMDEDMDDAVTKVRYEEYSSLTTESINGIIFQGVTSKRVERFKKCFTFYGETDDDYTGPHNAGSFGLYERVS